MISISHDLELIYARGEGEKGRGGKGEEREKKKGGEKKRVFFTLEAFPPPVQSNCHTAMHFRERVGGKEGKKGGKRGKKGREEGKKKRERKGEKEKTSLKTPKFFRGLRPRTPPSAGGATGQLVVSHDKTRFGAGF